MSLAEIYSLKDRVAVVTGAGTGIGRAAALLLAEAGARVGLLGRRKEPLDRVVEEIEKNGGEAMAWSADVSHPEDMVGVYAEVEKKWGRLDIVFANAGINGLWAPIEEIGPEDWDKTLQINLKGTFLTVKYAVPLLKKRGGAVVITASVNGTRMFSNTGATAYACSKAGQVAFAKMMALELADEKVRVNVICPGGITTLIDDHTRLQDLKGIRPPVEFPEGEIPLTGGKPGRAEQVARLVHFLVCDASDHITGTEVWIDGAQSLFQG